jgi:hypothetical protein
VRREGVLQVVFSGVEGKIPYKQFITHVMFYCPRLNFALTRLFPLIGFQIITELSSPEDSPCRGSSVLSNRRANCRTFPGNGKDYLDKSFRAKILTPSRSRS